MSVFKENQPDQLSVIWRSHTFPLHFRENYGFTQFAIELNELTEDLKAVLPNTDTRYRTDQRLYEEGQCNLAHQEKERLEQKQRDFRKKTEGQAWEPQWFVLQKNEQGQESWKYKGGYFEQRGQFKPQLDLFS